MKWCPKCQRTKRLSDFKESKTSKDGRVSPCNECRKKWSNIYEQQYKDKRKELNKRKERSVVYIIKGLKLYKIGHTNNFAKRWSMYVTHSDIQPTLIHLIKTPNRVKLEKQLHKLYASKRVHGEWFAINDNDITYLRSL